MKVYQQNIFGSEDEVVISVPVIAFENKVNKGRYLAESIDCADFNDENGDIGIDEIENAYLLVRRNFSVPDQSDVEQKLKEFRSYKNFMYEKYGEDCFISMNFEEVLENYNPVNVTISVAQYNAIAERNDWRFIE